MSDDGDDDEEEEELQHKMDTRQMAQRLHDAFDVHKQWAEQHGSTEATSGSMLRHVQDCSSSSSSSSCSSCSDSKGPDDSFAKTILRLVAAGRSVGETRRAHERSLRLGVTGEVPRAVLRAEAGAENPSFAPFVYI